MNEIHHRTIAVDGNDLFHREIGNQERPPLIMLHGFATSSRMFRDLIPLLAERFHLNAPDSRGFSGRVSDHGSRLDARRGAPS